MFFVVSPSVIVHRSLLLFSAFFSCLAFFFLCSAFFSSSFLTNIQIFYIIQLLLFFIEAIRCSFRFLSCPSNIQIIQAFLIQASYSVWRQPFYKHSNLQIIQSFFNSSQLFSVASAFQQTFISSNHSKFLLLKTALQHSFSFQHSHRNFFRNCFSSIVFKILLILVLEKQFLKK